MIFWIFVILTVLGIGVGAIAYHFDFEIISGIGWGLGVVSGIAVICMLCSVIKSESLADGERARYEQRYKALVYKSQTESIRDEFGIVNKEYIDEVQAWNEDLAKYQSYSHNFWIGIFYPKRKFDGLEFIELENIKMKE